MSRWELDYDSLLYAARRAGYTHRWGSGETINASKLAKDVGVQTVTMHLIVHKQERARLPQAETMLTLAELLECDVSDLVKKVED